jgi:hypothetical protein
MATKRVKTGHRRLGRFTLAQRTHLECGCYFFDFEGEADHFDDEDHRRSAWQAHRGLILAEWAHPGKRPVAVWEYDFGLEPDGNEWVWPAPAVSERDLVYRLLAEGMIEPCRLNGCLRIASELETIEKDWLHEIRYTVGSKTRRERRIREPLETYGTPPWFYAKHAARLIAEVEAGEAVWRARIAL